MTKLFAAQSQRRSNMRMAEKFSLSIIRRGQSRLNSASARSSQLSLVHRLSRQKEAILKNDKIQLGGKVLIALHSARAASKSDVR